MESHVMRAVDANLNRVSEGLRVIEDICRFLHNDGALQQQLKSMRHCLRSAVPAFNVLKYRNACRDVGFAAQGELELQRRDTDSLLQANFKRIQEGLRSLEELLKLTNPDVSRVMKSMRYESYEIEQFLYRRVGKKTLGRGLYLILTDPPHGYEALTEMAVRAELPAVQLRYKGDDDRVLLQLAKNMRAITRHSDTLCIINDRPDIALMTDADGVHVGQDDLPVGEVRRLIGPEMVLGLSTHNLDQVRCANEEQVDYIGFGPLYTTNSKARPDPVTGPDQLIRARQEAIHPIVAIGGLTPPRIDRLDRDLYNNVAVIRAVTMAEDPLQAMTSIQAILKN